CKENTSSEASSKKQNLRPLDDDNSPSVLEACRKKLDLERDSSTNASGLDAPSKPNSQWKKLFKTWKKKSIKRLSTKSSVKKICSKVVKSWDDVPAIDPNIGGFAEVYKGCLKGGRLVAVKRLTTESHEEMVNSFLSELGIIAHVNHRNIAKLIGYGVEGGTADGLLYLHEDCQRRIIHRDIKADNILLTENYEAQICDFGLAKWLPQQWTHHYISKFEGTFGYFAPEYFMDGIDGELSTVKAKPLLGDHDLKSLVDPVLGDDYDEEELDQMVLTASLCTQQTPVLRPRMNQANYLHL
ncbi:Receptor-like cytosolic serine/threonine-protein kinase RBK2, partial [Bienertia sinuspersici]